MLLVAACSGGAGEPDDNAGADTGPEAVDSDTTDDEAADADEPSDEAGDADEGDDEEDEASDDDGDDPGGAAPLSAEERAGEAEDDGDPAGHLAVTEVRIGAHEGFDRVTFELEGESTAGWFVAFEDEPTSQGSGEPIEVAGDAHLGVALRNISLPPDLPDEVERWEEGELAAPSETEAVVEVVQDTVFEGIELFYIGLDERTSYRIDRFDDPQRVVVDVLHR
ncbi:MAG: hypothetical protein ACLFRD_11280 [Nitriliruptoraceae bacterium]